jgi:8-oxo-dGTP pyrophosphatase MutT (NUDIX family)
VEPATRASWWITPGGGVERDESPEDALRRELIEELDLDVGPEPRPRVWVREHVFTWGPHAVRQLETYFLVEVPRAAARTIATGRWWSPDEIRTATDHVFAPRRFDELLDALHRDGQPADPIDTGI